MSGENMVYAKKSIEKILSVLVALDNLIVDEEIRNNEIFDDFLDVIETLDEDLKAMEDYL